MEYLLHVLILVGVYVILAVSLELPFYHAGMVSLCHACFYGIGAYGVAICSARSLGTPLFGVLAGCVVSVVVALFVALPSLRISDDYFVIATLSLQLVFSSVALNWESVTGGPFGIAEVRPLVIGELRVESNREIVLVVWIVALLSMVLRSRVDRSSFGAVLHAIKAHESVVCSFGLNPVPYKLIVFAMSAVLAALAGCFYAHYVSFVDPSAFLLGQSILMLSMVALGGAEARRGALFGAGAVVVLPEALRFIGFHSSGAAHLRQIVFGFVLSLLILARPHGIAMKREV